MSNPGNKLQNPTTQSLFSTVTSSRERGLQSVQWCTNHPTWSAIRCKFAFPNASQSHTCSCSSTSLLTLPLVLCRNIVLVRLSLQRIWSNKFRRILHHSYIWWPLAPSPANERHVHPWNWNRFLLQHGTVLLFTTNLLRPELRKYYDGELTLITMPDPYVHYLHYWGRILKPDELKSKGIRGSGALPVLLQL